MAHRFQFKQFSVRQDRCAMKVGTDGVLLGAWTSVSENPQTVLDIGAGTGLVALMLAQRCSAGTIDAVEVDPGAYEQCVENFEASPWADRLFCYHASLQEFAEEGETYDLIVSNPPFYMETVSSGTLERDLARQSAALPPEELLNGVVSLLSAEGLFSTIVPFKNEDYLRGIAASLGLYPRRMTRIKGNATAPTKRSLLEFTPAKVNPLKNELVIEVGRHRYTEDYKQLTSGFYLNMDS